MLLAPTKRLAEGANWSYELKLDGYRALAVKSGGRVQLRSRNNKDFSKRYALIAAALEPLPDETVLDGEIVALNDVGRPDFSLLQNYGVTAVLIVYFVFDVLVLNGRDVTAETLTVRRQLLADRVLQGLAEPIRQTPVFEADLDDLVAAVRQQGLEGLVAKRLDSRYEPGQRSGAWQKMRLNRTQEFVLGGWTPSVRNIDAVVFGHWVGEKLLYAGRTRSGFTPAVREKLQRQFIGLETDVCPFANLPEANSGRWGQGLTAEKMKDCRWLKPVLRADFEFVEFTPDGHLRHAAFVRLRSE